MNWLLVVLGAAVGAPLRYLTDRAVQSRHDTVFPWGTFTVNVVGCLILGTLTGAAAAGAASSRLQLLLGTGLCGALTTYSTFSYETLRLAQQGAQAGLRQVEKFGGLATRRRGRDRHRRARLHRRRGGHGPLRLLGAGGEQDEQGQSGSAADHGQVLHHASCPRNPPARLAGCTTGLPRLKPAGRNVQGKTMPHKYHVAGLGNAIVDVIARVEDDFLLTHKIAKGAMTLIDDFRALELAQALARAGNSHEVAGGSVANTMAGLASLGARGVYVGKVHDDRLGAVFGASMRNLAWTTPRRRGPRERPPPVASSR